MHTNVYAANCMQCASSLGRDAVDPSGEGSSSTPGPLRVFIHPRRTRLTFAFLCHTFPPLLFTYLPRPREHPVTHYIFISHLTVSPKCERVLLINISRFIVGSRSLSRLLDTMQIYCDRVSNLTHSFWILRLILPTDILTRHFSRIFLYSPIILNFHLYTLTLKFEVL